MGGDDTGSRVPCVILSLLSGSWDEEQLENETTTKVSQGPCFFPVSAESGTAKCRLRALLRHSDDCLE